MRFLVDTDWIISGLGGRASALDLFASLRDQGLAVSVVTLGEVYDGAYGTDDPPAALARYRRFLSGFTVLDVTEPIVGIFAGIRSSLRNQGNLIPDLDLLIPFHGGCGRMSAGRGDARGGPAVRTAYPSVIGESEQELAAAERRLRGRPAAARVRMLRLLKTGAAPTLGACAPLLGDSPRQVARWWAAYRAGGLAALTRARPRPGKAARLTPAARAGLEGEMRAGRIATLADARRYLAERWGIAYASLNGVWWQLRKHKTKPKTGRRRHRQADAAAQEAFKDGFRGRA
jgi:tRNA(fMet)-specific endonuclease VapC